jgi:hypothetical protein
MTKGPGGNPAPLFISASLGDDAGMTIVLFAAALLAQPADSNFTTARQLYDGCVLAIAGQPASPPANDAAAAAALQEALCEVAIAVELAVRAANDAMPENDPARTVSFCPPDAILQMEDATLPLARAYVAWFDRHPEAQDSTTPSETLAQALRETWPCPH